MKINICAEISNGKVVKRSKSNKRKYYLGNLGEKWEKIRLNLEFFNN
jgi:hypothetical protein